MLCLPYAALLASVVSAASTPQVQYDHLKLDFSVLRGDSRSTATKGASVKVVSSGNYSNLYLANAQSYYSATLKIGSKGNKNTVLVDTGSSDLWVMASDVACYTQTSPRKRSFEEFPVFSHYRLLEFDTEDTTAPTNDIGKREDKATTTVGADASTASASVVRVNPSTCTSLGSFNTAASSSFKVNSTAPKFGIAYGDGSYANGVWGTDTVAVGGLNLSSLSIAVVNDTTSEFGVLGIGLPGLEVTYAYSDGSKGYTYENFPARLKSTGAIKKVAYSLYLNDTSSSSGTILFGAVDHTKYSGQLQTVPIINNHPKQFKKPISIDVVLNSITLGDSKQNISVSSDPIPALLDSGTTLTYLPTPILNSIVASLNGKATNQGYYQVSCKYNTSSAFVIYNLSGVSIKVPLSDLIMSDIKGKNCYLGVMGSPAYKPEAILGDNFLRHAYVVYDLEEYEVSLAQVKYSSSENIQVISSSIPSAVKAPGYSSTSVVSSVGISGPSSTLSVTGLKNSADSKAHYFARSLIFGVIGVSLIFVL
ncbi:hypothetical protein JCM33374_g4821 [Metschnikowia sp. JCM 33374]|nr:hypothetical protein JCM33374_g4821 [Metschnikowia sp. JCM 33374]